MNNKTSASLLMGVLVLTSTVFSQTVSTDRLAFKTAANGLASLTFNGVDYNYIYGEPLVGFIVSGGSRFNSSCSRTFTANENVHTCVANGQAFVVRVSYSTDGSNTLRARATVTNNSRLPIDQVGLHILGWKTTQLNRSDSRVNGLNRDNPVEWANMGQHKVFFWSDSPSPAASVSTACGWSIVCKHTATTASIPAGGNFTHQYAVRFVRDTSLTPFAVAPEAYALFRAVYPASIRWADRRPIMSWFVAEGGKRSASNPRGYLQDASLNAKDITRFKSRIMTDALRIRDAMLARPVRPQGVILWDIEGQEFDHATTYIGDPTAFEKGYAPEMNAAIDDVMAVFSNAGFRTGITLRPQKLQFGKTLPSRCKFDTNNDYRDYFIKVDEEFGKSFHACYDPAGLRWSVIPRGNGGQTFFRPNQMEEQIQLLLEKARYANKRWGTTIFYVDTAVWVGGKPIEAEIFRRLQVAMPDSLFIPEQEGLGTVAHAIPFTDPRNAGDARFIPASWRWVYPNAAMAARLPDCQGDCWTRNGDALTVGQEIGDIALYNVPHQMNIPHLVRLEQMIQNARVMALKTTVRDIAGTTMFSVQGKQVTAASTVGKLAAGQPGTQFPTSMRVYFGNSAAAASNSNTFCTAVDLIGGNTCFVNLSGMTHYQIRYFTYAGTQVSTETPVKFR